MVAGAVTVGAGLLVGGSSALAQHEKSEKNGGLTKGDAVILRFLAAAEILESDLWLQYQELAGTQDNEVSTPFPNWIQTWRSTFVPTTDGVRGPLAVVDRVDPPGDMFLLQSVSPCGRIGVNSGSLGVPSSDFKRRNRKLSRRIGGSDRHGCGLFEPGHRG
jgi:hypothetical protein